MLNTPVVCTEVDDASAFGAVIMNGFARGLWKSFEEVKGFRKVTEVFNPSSHLSPLTSHLSPAVIYGDTAIVDSEGKFLHLRRLRPPKQLTWRSFKQGMLVCHQAFYVRTDIAQQEDYDLQYRHSADVDWCIRVMKRAEEMRLPLVNANTILADFMEGGNTTQNHRASLKERYQVMCHHYGKVSTMVMHAWFLVRQLFR
jgi:hypothetical protein